MYALKLGALLTTGAAALAFTSASLISDYKVTTDAIKTTPSEDRALVVQAAEQKQCSKLNPDLVANCGKLETAYKELNSGSIAQKVAKRFSLAFN